jgi:chorismate--pyruvate lyase
MGIRENRGRSRRLEGRVRGSHWHPLGKALKPPAHLRPWLLEPDSLTLRLQRHYGPISVRVLHQALGQSYDDEGNGRFPLAVVRAVVLSASDQSPLVVAHSVLPAVPRGPLSVMFHQLGRQALGSLLFTRRGFVRRQREWAFLDARHPLYRMARHVLGEATPARLWARRAVYSQSRYPQQSVQVTEVFCIPP